jgi:hypothetical protein
VVSLPDVDARRELRPRAGRVCRRGLRARMAGAAHGPAHLRRVRAQPRLRVPAAQIAPVRGILPGFRADLRRAESLTAPRRGQSPARPGTSRRR